MKRNGIWLVAVALFIMLLSPLGSTAHASVLTLKNGVYTVGKEIPAGLNTYIVTNGYADIDIYRDGEMLTYEELESARKILPDRFTARLRVGDEVEIIKYSLSTQLTVQPAGKVDLNHMGAGLYVAGIDFPVGTYHLEFNKPINNDYADVYIFDKNDETKEEFELLPFGKRTVKVVSGDQVNTTYLTGTMSFTPQAVAPQSIDLNRTALSLMVNRTSQLTATVQPATATNKGITWTSSNPAVATVDVNGNVKAIKIGTATITATAKGATAVKKSVPVTVTKVLPSSITLSKTKLGITNNQTFKVSATIAPADAAVKTVIWKSSNTKVATVDSAGNIKGLASGTATITATAKDNPKVLKSIAVTVSPKAVKLDKTALTIAASRSATLIATVSPADSIEKTVTWTSSNAKVATVDAKGKVTAKAAGTATISASVKGAKTVTAKVTVTPPVLASSVKMSLGTATLAKGKTLTLTGTVSPTNTTNKTLVWKSSNPKVATVDSKGKVTALTAGTVKVTATTTNGKVATATITVK